MSSATARRPADNARSSHRARGGPEVIAGVRIIPRDGREPPQEAALKRLDAHVQRYIEAHWLGGVGSSRRHLRLRPWGYALMDASARPELAVAVTEFARRMGDFLFGDEADRPADILVHVAESRDVALFLHAAPDDARALAVNADDADTDAFDNADAATNAGSDAATPTAAAEPQMRFFGVYDARHGVIIASVAALISPGVSRPIDPAAYAELEERPLEDVHAFTLASAEAERTRPRKTGAPLIYAPVDYSVVAQPAQLARFLEAASALPERSLGLILCGAPNFASHERLRAGMRRLMTRFRFIDWEVSAGRVEPGHFVNTGLHSITLTLPASEVDGRLALQQFLANAQALRARRIRIGVRGLRDADSVARCVSAGVDFVAGPAVTPLADIAFTPRRVAVADLPVSVRKPGPSRPAG